MTNDRGASKDQLLRDIAWGAKNDLFDDPVGEAMLRAWSVGAGDGLEELIEGRVRPKRVDEAFGRLMPFRRPHLTEGEILLGRDAAGSDVRLPLQSFTAGLLVAANTGAGKTNLLQHLLLQIAGAGCPVWVSDMYKTQLRHLRPLFAELGQHLVILRPADWRVNLLEPLGDPRTYLPMVVDLLTRTLGLPPRSRSILLQGCHAIYQRFSVFDGQREGFPCLFDLYEWIHATPGLNASAREAILDRLGTLLVSLTPRAAAYRRAWRPVDLARFSVCFEMRSASELVKQVLLEPALHAVMRSEMDSGAVNAKINLFVAFEDSQRFFNAQESSGDLTPMDELAGVIRGSGKGLGVIVQTMQGMSSRLLPNLATKIMGRMGSNRDYRELSSDLAMSREQLEWARRNLRPGRYILQASDGDWREPCILHVPHLRVPTAVGDTDAERSLEPLRALPVVAAAEYARWEPRHLLHVSRQSGSAPPFVEPKQPPKNVTPFGPSRRRTTSTPEVSKPRTLPAPEPTVKRPAETGRSPLSKPLLDYLQSIAEDPFLNVTERDQKLGLSAWKGNRFRTELERLNLIGSIAINPGGRGKRFKLLDLTKAGRDLLASYDIKPRAGSGRGGLEHRWWVNHIYEWLTPRVERCTVESEDLGARVDIDVVAKDGRRIAVEVEIGQGHENENLEKDAAAGYNVVVSLQKARPTRSRPRRPLAREGQRARVLEAALVGYGNALEAVLTNVTISHTEHCSSGARRRPNDTSRRSSRESENDASGASTGGERIRQPKSPPSHDATSPVSDSPRREQRPVAAEAAGPKSTSGDPTGRSDRVVFNTDQAADYLGSISPRTLETMRSRGGGPTFVKLGRRVAYRKTDLDHWLQQLAQ